MAWGLRRWRVDRGAYELLEQPPHPLDPQLLELQLLELPLLELQLLDVSLPEPPEPIGATGPPITNLWSAQAVPTSTLVPANAVIHSRSVFDQLASEPCWPR